MTLTQLPRPEWRGAVVRIRRKVEGRGPKIFTYEARVVEASDTGTRAKVIATDGRAHITSKWMDARVMEVVSVLDSSYMPVWEVA